MAANDKLRINITRNAEAIVVAFAGDLDVFVADDAHARVNEESTGPLPTRSNEY